MAYFRDCNLAVENLKSDRDLGVVTLSVIKSKYPCALVNKLLSKPFLWSLSI